MPRSPSLRPSTWQLVIVFGLAMVACGPETNDQAPAAALDVLEATEPALATSSAPLQEPADTAQPEAFEADATDTPPPASPDPATRPLDINLAAAADAASARESDPERKPEAEPRLDEAPEPQLDAAPEPEPEPEPKPEPGPEMAPEPQAVRQSEATRSIARAVSMVRAARLFGGPGQYPPEDFAAYGIVAFQARASSADRDRHMMVCEAYVAALPRTAELGLPEAEQMVTIWPIDDTKMADRLNDYAPPNLCETAVAHYGLPTALQAIRDAGDEHIGRNRRGPFLLAWSPSVAKGSENALILFADLSDVTTPEQASAFFVTWRDDIEGNPEYWAEGWNVERLRVGIRLWVDRFGSQIFSILGA